MSSFIGTWHDWYLFIPVGFIVWGMILMAIDPDFREEEDI